MLRFFAGVGSALLLVAAGFFIVKSQAEAEDVIPPAPEAAALLTPLKQPPRAAPLEASEKTREEKRFARADKNDDGRIMLAELYEPRRKAFAKLDVNGDGRLSFEEWAVKTSDKFAKADADGNGVLTPPEFETTRAKRAPKKKCAC